MWGASSHKFIVKDCCGRNAQTLVVLAVDPDPPADKYAEAKQVAYDEAINEWSNANKAKKQRQIHGAAAVRAVIAEREKQKDEKAQDNGGESSKPAA